MDVSEPISPELVLVCPELRELALANAREFPAPQPYRPQPARARAPERPQRTPPRRRAAARLVLAAAVVFVLAALAVAPGFTGGGRPTLEPRRPKRAAAPNREATVPVSQRPDRSRSKRKPRAETAVTPAKQPSPHRSVVPRRTALELEREAEQNVLRSPRFFLEQGGAAAALVDPATKLFRANTTVTCSVTQRRHNGSWERMCSVRHGRVSIRVRYVPTGRSSFRLATPAAAP
jgi:hypothetical protein